jgi:hypothetical protein
MGYWWRYDKEYNSNKSVTVTMDVGALASIWTGAVAQRA